MADNFEYISHASLEFRHDYRHAYLGEVPSPVVYGVQGALRTYYGAGEGPPVASTLDHISPVMRSGVDTRANRRAESVLARPIRISLARRTSSR